MRPDEAGEFEFMMEATEEEAVDWYRENSDEEGESGEEEPLSDDASSED
jgi:hypothetical protein